MKSNTHHLLILSISLAASAAHAAVVFNDTFDSGTGNWYKAGTTGSLTNASSKLSWAESDSNLAEAIGRSFATQSVAVGETIRLTFDFTWSCATTTGNAQIFRVGLFDVTNAIGAGNWSASNAIGASAGYYTFIRDGNGTGNTARQESYGSVTNTVGPTNGGGTQVAMGSNSTNYNINDNGTVTYQGLFEVTRTGASTTTTLFTLMEGLATRFSVSGSQTSGAFVNSFDTVVIKAGASNPTITLDNVKLETIPEPGAAALLGLGGLFLLRRRR
jgi:hypothetical protein